MHTDQKIAIIKEKLDMIPKMRELVNDAPDFKKWHATVNNILVRLSKRHQLEFAQIHFTSMVSFGDSDDRIWDHRAFIRGLDDTEAILESVIEDLRLWDGIDENRSEQSKASKSDTTINLTISQQQSQQVINDIDLSQYDTEVQANVRELLDELKKKQKDRKRIQKILLWLSDKGVDALIAVLLSRMAH